jgi:putative intracellular protease/amidase
MGNRQLWGEMLFLFLCLFLAVAGIVINAEAASGLVSSSTSAASGETALQITAKAKQALLVIFPYFPEPEYSAMRSILENKGVKVVVASSSVDPMPGYEKKLTVKPDMLLSQVRTEEYDAIVFIGRYGYPGDNADAIRIAKEGAAESKVLAASDYGVMTLVKANLLKAKKIATDIGEFWTQKAGASKSAASVERDGIIITGSRGASHQFAETVAAALTAGSE